jgi:hypothetical protein
MPEFVRPERDLKIRQNVKTNPSIQHSARLLNLVKTVAKTAHPNENPVYRSILSINLC